MTCTHSVIKVGWGPRELCLLTSECGCEPTTILFCPHPPSRLGLALGCASLVQLLLATSAAAPSRQVQPTQCQLHLQMAVWHTQCTP